MILELFHFLVSDLESDCRNEVAGVMHEIEPERNLDRTKTYGWERKLRYCPVRIISLNFYIR